jgi:hypothetical protein
LSDAAKVADGADSVEVIKAARLVTDKREMSRLVFVSAIAAMTTGKIATKAADAVGANIPDFFTKGREINMTRAALLGHMMWGMPAARYRNEAAKVKKAYMIKIGGHESIVALAASPYMKGKEERASILSKYPAKLMQGSLPEMDIGRLWAVADPKGNMYFAPLEAPTTSED